MNNQIKDINDQEKAKINLVLDILYSWSNKKENLDRLMNRWEKLVTRMGVLYVFTVDDYTNDLCIRDRFEEIISKYPRNEIPTFSAWVESFDQKFMTNSVGVSSPLLKSEENGKVGWWWYRVPLMKTKDFGIYQS